MAAATVPHSPGPTPEARTKAGKTAGRRATGNELGGPPMMQNDNAGDVTK